MRVAQSPTRAPKVAVIIPCHNEARAIATVVRDFQAALPDALVVVADNASEDDTAAVASAAGALVVSEPRIGKGWAVRKLFADVDADVYLLTDGDGECDPGSAKQMVQLVADGNCDMVIGSRRSPDGVSSYRPGHRLGNATLTWIFQRLFDFQITDTLSGYRAISRRVVKSFPSRAIGFELEAELNAHAAVVGVNVAEVPTVFHGRPFGDPSKLSTIRDGMKILRLNLRLFRDARPALAFMILSIPWLLITVWCLTVALRNYLESGSIISLPNLIAGLIAFMIFLMVLVAGITMERVTRNRNEVLLLAYLSQPGACQISHEALQNDVGRTGDRSSGIR